LLDPIQQELQCQGCFAGAGIAFDQLKVPLWQPAAEDVVQTRDAGPDTALASAGSNIGFAGKPLVSVHSVPVNAHRLSTCFDPNRFGGVAPPPVPGSRR
jgi:hypothetical protein